MNYYLSRVMTLSYEDAEARTRASLEKQGFGVLTEIDVKATLKKKLDADFRKYIILGACNPPFAHRALQAEAQIGLLLPCNVVVQDREDGTVEVSAIDPVVAMQVVDNPRLAPIAKEIRTRLQQALEDL